MKKRAKKWSRAAAVPALVILWASLADAAPDRGAVYALTNDASGNAAVVYARLEDGRLFELYRVETGGLGSGGGLGSQNALVQSPDGALLFAVNAGSDEIAVLRVVADVVVELVEVEPSLGDFPTSLAVHDGILYVLNAGDVDTITGFRIGATGELEPIPGSTRMLSAASTQPAQVEFDPSGRWLVVTERATNRIDLFPVEEDGTLGDAIFVASAGETPFGFAFRGRRTLILSEAFGGAADASAVSSYRLERDGSLVLVEESAPTNETAACWIVVTHDGRFAYATNTGSGSISGFRVRAGGMLDLLDPDGRTGETGTGSGPIDLALSRRSRFLYSINGANGTISAFAVHRDGSLAPVETEVGLPIGAAGIVAR